MPLDYGSMDSESSPSPSSLEKTVEGMRGDEVVEVGGNEVVGVEGDSIPITVVEVEGRGERDYDGNAKIVEEVKQYRSELRTRDSLGHLVETYEISSRVLVRPAGVEERACSTPRDHWMPVYSHYLIAGLRFPLPELLIGLLLDYNIGLTQLVPNAMRVIICFLLYCRAQGISVPTVNMGARWFINSTFPEMDKRNAREEALRYGGASVVKQVLESTSWVNGLAQQFRESTRERALLQRQCDQLQKEKDELEKKNKDLQESLDEVVPTAGAGELTKEAFLELKGNVQTLVHNWMKEHISNFISSSSFDNIVNLYRLPTAIIAFTDCRKKVKAEYPKVDITKITFGEQEEGVEEDGERISADLRPQIKLRWEDDANGRAVFPPQFDFELVAVEEEGAEVEEDKMEAGAGGAEVDKCQPILEVEIHPVPSDDERPLLPNQQQPTQPPSPAEQEPAELPFPQEK
ncbi:hypothetical protein SLEP1_g9408 [Rubroshorea leprosula]|uniref:Uncharacterized protein n=1 Tax=Rubroshorea leprosula TaxID=152421 RepID=A0AAV5I4T7_9ROSI|nr:hypothetical protein SLEP1_g9408 [Rubroshorea leprosula]